MVFLTSLFQHCSANIQYVIIALGVVSKSFEYGAGPQTCQKEEVGSSVMSSIRTADRSVNGGFKFLSDSDSPPVPAVAL